jgi:hypothetical protein
MGEIQLTGFVCERCEHSWVPRMDSRKPRVCPKCKSPYWNRPRNGSNGSAVRDKGHGLFPGKSGEKKKKEGLFG